MVGAWCARSLVRLLCRRPSRKSAQSGRSSVLSPASLPRVTFGICLPFQSYGRRRTRDHTRDLYTTTSFKRLLARAREKERMLVTSSARCAPSTRLIGNRFNHQCQIRVCPVSCVRRLSVSRSGTVHQIRPRRSGGLQRGMIAVRTHHTGQPTDQARGSRHRLPANLLTQSVTSMDTHLNTWLVACVESKLFTVWTSMEVRPSSTEVVPTLVGISQ